MVTMKEAVGSHPAARTSMWEINPMSELYVRAVSALPVKRSEPRLDRTTFTASRHKPSRRHFVCLEGVYPGETFGARHKCCLIWVDIRSNRDSMKGV